MTAIYQWRNEHGIKFIRLLVLVSAAGTLYLIVSSLSPIGTIPPILDEVRLFILPSVRSYIQPTSFLDTQESNALVNGPGEVKQYQKGGLAHKQIYSASTVYYDGNEKHDQFSGKISSQENDPNSKYERNETPFWADTTLKNIHEVEQLGTGPSSTDVVLRQTSAFVRSTWQDKERLLKPVLNETIRSAIRVHVKTANRSYAETPASKNKPAFFEFTSRKGQSNSSLKISSQSLKKYNEIRLILLWTPLYKGWDFFPIGQKAFSNPKCSETKCEVTVDRSRLYDSHVVVFHIRTMSLLDLPPNRLPHQKWVFFTLEAPPHSYFSGFTYMYKMFNWTMTYRLDSDIVVPYGRVSVGGEKKFSLEAEVEWKKKWKSKRGLAVWMVSNCVTPSNRENYIYKLQNYMDVDILGFCGSAVCPYNKTEKCLESFSKRYKFFLAFENAICEDYVTEKFFKVLNYDIVPVVLGGADYELFAPPDSYINAMDFHSPEQLADYLYDVGKNFTLYKKYLKWKQDGFTIQDTPYYCPLCQKLHSSDFNSPSSYKDIAYWWNQKSKCTKWKT